MRIAVAQAPGVRLEEWRETRALVDEFVGQAAGRGAALVVLPECVWPAYCLGSAAAYRAARKAGLPGTKDFVDHLLQLAAGRRIAVCAGFVEEDGGRLYNTAAVIDAGGRELGRHRKCFLWGADHDYFTAGAALEPFTTPFGRVGIMVCADARLPETAATLASRGAGLILQPTAWVNGGTAEIPWNPQPDFLIAARAAEFGVPIASASKWGREEDETFVGSSLICDHTGRALVQCGPAETTVAVADVELTTPRRPQVTPEQRAVLLGTGPVRRPRADVPDLDVELCADGTVVLRTAGAAGRVTGPRADIVEVGGVSAGTLAGADVEGFAAARCLALGGVHAIVVFGPVARGMLRARACENRVYVIHIDPRGWVVVGPRGQVSAEGAWEGGAAANVRLPVREAAEKCVAPGTDMVAGRWPAMYAF